METASFKKYEPELSFLFNAIEKGYPFSESSDIRENWGIEPAEQTYDRGHVILLPKKTRLKYGLKVGLTTNIRAGNRITSAKSILIHSHSEIQISSSFQRH